MKKISLAVMMILSPAVFAETTDPSAGTMEPSPSMDMTGGDSMTGDTMTGAETTTSTNNGQVVQNLSASFEGFLGDQAQTVVEGLRNGEEFTLTSSYTDASGTQQTETITIEPPTSKMGYGNVKITLKMAENLLNQAGIEQPTAIQLETALLGGSLTTSDGTIVDVDGVLTLRSEGMGWGQIAKQYDTKVGALLGNANSKSVNNASSSKGSNITTASGDAVGSRGNGNAKVKSHDGGKGHAYGQGIVSASGSSIGAGASFKTTGSGKVHHGGGHAIGQGITTAGGGSATHSNAGGLGKGRGKVK